jgi:uncharacterized Zn-finger protein
MTTTILLPDYDFDKDIEIFPESPPKPNLIDCSYCAKKFSSKQILELHQVFQHRVLLYKCPKKYCAKSFFREEYLKEHITLVHTGRIEKTYKCTKVQKCIDKGVAFRTQGELNQHLLFHGPKKFICNECKNTFTTKGNLKDHKKIHTGEKTYLCRFEGCNDKFISSSSRLWHEKRYH